jgi:hypothetical protein
MGNIDLEKFVPRILADIKIVEEKFAKIQENPALHGAENGFTAQELEILEKLIKYLGEANLAADEISKRWLAGQEEKDSGKTCERSE